MTNLLNRDFWTKGKTLRLIELYGDNDFLWDCTHGLYRSKQKRIEGYLAIAEELGTSVDEVKRKLDSLLAQYRREKTKAQQVSLGEREYKDAWWGLKPFSFLDDQYLRKHFVGVTPKSEYQLEDDVNVREDGLLKAGFEEDGVDIGEVNHEESHVNEEAPVALAPARTPSWRPMKRKMMVKKKEPIKIMKVCYPSVMKSGQEGFRDEFTAYGETVAHRLRGLTSRKSCCVVMNQIDNLLFNAQMEEFDAEKELITFLPAESVGTFEQVCEQTLDQ